MTVAHKHPVAEPTVSEILIAHLGPLVDQQKGQRQPTAGGRRTISRRVLDVQQRASVRLGLPGGATRFGVGL